MRLYDMHCHLGFFADAEAAALQAERSESGFFSVTVTPEEYEFTSRLFESSENVRVGLGLHPWWIADDRRSDEALEAFEAGAKKAPYVGEVGLDFGKRCEGTETAQCSAFTRVSRACAQGAAHVVSIHAVRAEDAVLDILEQEGCLRECACIMHWFSGSSKQLLRAIDAGCYFSVGPRMLASKRGRAYVKTIPKDRLLLETDAPFEEHSVMAFQDYETLLREALVELSAILGEDIAPQVRSTSARLLSMC